jgi:phosphoribosylformylglycinamidine synthase
MKVRIIIGLKKSVLDTQGKAIENSLVKNLGYEQISQVRQGKFVELEIDENDSKKVKEIVDQICDKLLVNKIIEDYSYEVL